MKGYMAFPTPPLPPSLWGDDSDDEEDPSVHQPGDIYDHLGRNSSAQQRRQEEVPWQRVKRRACMGKEAPHTKKVAFKQPLERDAKS